MRETREPQAIVGEAPNVAARLQEVAAPNTVVISAATARLVDGYFTLDALGPQVLKGVAMPVPVYRVVGESTAQTRLDVAIIRGLTPFVGREHEVALLLERWASVKDSRGQVILLSGEAGIGKSRLAQAFREHLAGETYTRIVYNCSPYYQQSAFYPVVEHIQRLLQFRKDDTPEEKLHKLEAALGPYDFALEEMVPLLAALLSLPLPERYPPLTLTPQRQKQKTLEALLAWLLKEADRQPVCLVMEDLHWADPSTLELLNLLLDQAPLARLLILLLFRPDFRPPWAIRSHLTHLTLSRLPHHQVETMVERITAGKALPGEVLQQLVTKTDGVPLFVEESTKMVLESGLVKEWEGRYVLTGPLPPLAIPATLHDSLMARLDRLETAKAVAQLGATIGREFAYEVIRLVSPVEETTLQRGLAQLVEAELLYQRGLPPQARYLFKHALIQDTAYASLLRSTRQQYHRQIAQALEAQFPETCETHPELVAHHYTEAGLHAQALPYWQRAGQRAIERSANVEAVDHLTKGLEVLKTLPETPKRNQQELPLQIALGVSLSMLKGFTAQEVERAYSRARELCQYVGDSLQRFRVLIGLKQFYRSRAELKTAQELGIQLLELAQSIQDPDLLLEAYSTQGQTLFHLGEFTSALAHLEQGIIHYAPQRRRPQTLYQWHDRLVACLSYAARALWYLGYPDQALRRGHEALSLAKQLPHTHAMGTNLIAMLHRERREPQLVQELAEAAMALSSEHGFIRWLGAAMIWRGWALAERGALDEGIAQLNQGLATWRAIGTEQGLPYYLAMLAEQYKRAERVAEGLGVLAEALTAIHKGTECLYEAELYRLQGELLLTLSAENQAEAEGCFFQAINIACHQHAKSLELRAVISLSRLWQQQGKRTEAYQRLAEIYGWFTEGFDTPDLQEAKTLLGALQ